LLFWSALVRSKPFLWAVVVPILAGALNSWIALLGIPHISIEFFWKVVARSLLSVVPGGWVSVMKVGDSASTFADPPAVVRHFGSYAQMAHVFTTPELWIGAIAGIVLIAVAIWLRRWRSEA
jgi:ABC-2 type transport system permease protein